jgi:hypothetical protein
VNELLSYVFSPLREGDIALYRGYGTGLAPILLVAAEETSLGCVERLEHEYALKGELDAGWAARPVTLTHHNDRMRPSQCQSFSRAHGRGVSPHSPDFRRR